MNLQFYETIQDKSKEYITYLIENILPKFTTGEFNYFLGDLGDKTNKKSKTKTSLKWPLCFSIS